MADEITPEKVSLTRRELDVLRLLAKGYTSTKIAETGHRPEHGNGLPEEASQEDEGEPGRRVGFQGHGAAFNLMTLIKPYQQ